MEVHKNIVEVALNDHRACIKRKAEFRRPINQKLINLHREITGIKGL